MKGREFLKFGLFGICLWTSFLLIHVSGESMVKQSERVRRGGSYGGGYSHGHGGYYPDNHGDEDHDEEDDNSNEKDCESKLKEECSHKHCMVGEYCTANSENCNSRRWRVVCKDCKKIRKCKKIECTNSTDSVCKKCKTGYYLDGTTKSCKACSPIVNCTKIVCEGPSSSKCLWCRYGYTQAEQQTKCVACKKIENCIFLSCRNTESSICWQCKTGYKQNKNSSACVECPSRKPIENCEKQVIRRCFKSVCMKCKDGYYVKRGKCKACPSQQAIENCEDKKVVNCDKSKCRKCRTGHYLQDEKCLKCNPISNCLNVTCTSQEDQKCLKCIPSYKPTNGGSSCVACPSQQKIPNCIKQVAKDCEHGICKECEEGYFSDGRSCKVCPSQKPIQNCLESIKIDCHNSRCKRCADGYYVNGDFCIACPIHSPIPHCIDGEETCFENKCKRCMDGYTLTGNICTECPDQPPIDNCVDIYKGTNCADAVCTKCADGYYLDTNKCLECPSQKPILNCDVKRQVDCLQSVCDRCSEGYYWNGKLCTACNPLANCLKVSCTTSVDTKCDQCEDTYRYDFSTNQCVVCPSQSPIENCQVAKIIDCEQNTCERCADGYFSDANVCKACPSRNKIINCEVQDIIDCQGSICRQCKQGYYSTGSTCDVCSSIDKCTNIQCSTDRDQVCLACIDTFRPSTDRKMCIGCPSQMAIPHCRSKRIIDCELSVCNQCEDGYFPFSNTCEECPSKSQDIGNCEEKQIVDCTTSSCKKCRPGFFSENNGCTACNAAENCLNVICTNRNDQTCTLCKPLYKHDVISNKCMICPSQKEIPNCLKQSTVNCESSLCEQCEDGYYFDGSKCKECLPIPNCLSQTCLSGNVSKCVACDDEYKLSRDGHCEVCPSSIPLSKCRRQAVVNCDSAVCEQCQHGYYFDGISCTRCVDIPFCLNMTCTSSDDQQCLKCTDGLQLDDQSKECITCPSEDAIPLCKVQRSINCDKAVCDECFYGHFFDGTSCRACPAIPHCTSVTCSSLKDGRCRSCEKTYMYDDVRSECVECPALKVKIPHCLEYRREDCFKVVCDQCDNGFSLQGSQCKEIKDVNILSVPGEQKDENIFSENSSARIAIFVFAAFGGLLCAAVIIFLVFKYCKTPTSTGKSSKALKKEIDISMLENTSNERKHDCQASPVPVLNLADVTLTNTRSDDLRRYSKDHCVEELSMKNGSMAKSVSSVKTTHSKKSHKSASSHHSRTSHRTSASHHDRFRDPRKYWYGTNGYGNAAFSNGVYGYMPPDWRY